MTQKTQEGVIHIAILLITGLLIGAVTLTVVSPEQVKEKIFKKIALVTKNETVTESPTSSPDTALKTNSPTPTAKTPTPTPESTKTPTTPPTPKPTQVATNVSSGPPGSGYSRYTVSTERGVYTINLVSIDMSGVRMITDTANDNDCGDGCNTLPLSDFVSRNGGFAGINGSYFCPSTYSECAGKANSFDFPVYNSRLNKWINSGNLFWNNRSIVYFDGSGIHFLRNANSFGGGLSSGIVNHPGLIEGGNIIADQFGLSSKQSSKGTKSGIGIRGNVVYLVVASNVDMLDLAHIFKSLGATYAMNLDGGGSSALWFGGYKAGPGRNIPNAVIFAR